MITKESVVTNKALSYITSRINLSSGIWWQLRPLGLALFLTLLGTCGRAQISISGTLSDPADNPLAYGTVSATLPGHSKIIAYALTDDKGKFVLNMKSAPDSVALSARYLGYDATTLLLALPFSEGLNIRLKKSENALPEISVRSERPPVVEKGDTTVYNVDIFKTEDSERVEDLLRSIPGVVVKESGAIEVNGKPLSRILVEGSDLFGRDYQLGSKISGPATLAPSKRSIITSQIRS